MQKKKPRGRPFVKGQIANPKGRPRKEVCIPDILREIGARVATDKDGLPVLDKDGNPITLQRLTLIQIYKQAASGDLDCLKFIAERTEGKVAEKFQELPPDDLSQLSDDELQAYIDAHKGA